MERPTRPTRSVLCRSPERTLDAAGGKHRSTCLASKRSATGATAATCDVALGAGGKAKCCCIRMARARTEVAAAKSSGRFGASSSPLDSFASHEPSALSRNEECPGPCALHPSLPPSASPTRPGLGLTFRGLSNDPTFQAALQGFKGSSHKCLAVVVATEGKCPKRWLVGPWACEIVVSVGSCSAPSDDIRIRDACMRSESTIRSLLGLSPSSKNEPSWWRRGLGSMRPGGLKGPQA